MTDSEHHDNTPGNIPVLTIHGSCLAQAWENSLLSLYDNGTEVRTEYDRKDKSGRFTDPPSLDCTMIMVIDDPLGEPMIHRAFPGGLEDLEEYRQEVLDGIKDHWVRDRDDPDDKRWEYTYHQRLTAYKVPGIDKPIDQLEETAKKLAEVPYSRRAQAITWQPWEDIGAYDPACLQSMWFRMLPADEKNESWKLNMNIRFRSRDAYDAAFMNCFAFVNLQKRMARRIESLSGRQVTCGRYVDMSDSYHVYGRRREHFENNFLKLIKTRKFEDRTWPTEFAQPLFDEAKPMIKKKIIQVDEQRKNMK